MKSNIALKLTVSFTVALLIFSVVIGSVFALLFHNYTTNLHRENMLNTASTISGTISSLMGRWGTSAPIRDSWFSSLHPPTAGENTTFSFQAESYIRFINSITSNDVWVVDRKHNIMRKDTLIPYSDLSAQAESVIERVFTGEILYSEDFSDFLDVSSLTVGVPIYSDHRVIGVVLLHAPVAGIRSALANGLSVLLLSIALALLIGIGLSVSLAVAFTRPLKRIKDTALQLADGNYTARTEVVQRDEIGELAETMDVLGGRLEIASQEEAKLSKLRRDFVANVSHELRTPVTVMRGSLEALCEGVVTDPAQVEEYHRQLLQESLFLQRMVNELLELSRLQNEDFSLEMAEINLCDCIRDGVRSGSRLGSARGISISLELDREIVPLRGDYDRLKQMLLIVLDNAVKFSDPGEMVRVRLQGRVLSVADRGASIPEEELETIFERFVKTRQENNPNGTGLGLAIAKQIAERHGIDIRVSSEPEGDTVFSFFLPEETSLSY